MLNYKIYDTYDVIPCVTCESFCEAVCRLLFYLKRGLFTAKADVCISDMVLDTVTVNDKLVAKSFMKGEFDMKNDDELDMFLSLYDTARDMKTKYMGVAVAYSVKQIQACYQETKTEVTQMQDCHQETTPKVTKKTKRTVDVRSEPPTVEEIEKLRETKQLIESKIDDFNKELEAEKDDLQKEFMELNDEMYKYKKEEEKLNQQISIFISDKTHTYEMILRAMMNSKETKEIHYSRNGDLPRIQFDKVPPLFAAKFPIFLFMDGRDTSGNTVRERLLDTQDEYDIYRMLYDSIYNDDFEMPENESYEKIVGDFINFLPFSFDVATEKEIMEKLNEKDRSNGRLFTDKYTERRPASD